jgi:hypothetical protein
MAPEQPGRAGAGASGQLQSRFEDGLRFLTLALALEQDHRSPAAVVSSACDALNCFLAVLDAAAQRHLPDPAGGLRRLREQCEALLTPRQDAEEAQRHAIDAALLARDQTALLLPRLLGRAP